MIHFILPSGRVSRKTGFSEYLRQCYADPSGLLQVDEGDDSQHWFDRRQDIFKAAVEHWNNEDPLVKEAFGESAKVKNTESNTARDVRIAINKENDLKKKKEQKELVQSQVQVVTAALDSGLVKTGDGVGLSRLASHDNPSSSCDALVSSENYDDDREHLSNTQLQLAEQCFDRTGLSHDAVLGLMDECPTSLCGLGDESFAISEKILDFATSKTGFVESGHRQLNNDYGFICETMPRLEIEEQTSLDNGYMSCEQLLGRYCRSEISNLTKFNTVIAMLQNVVRTLMSRRTVKCGQTLFMGFDTLWPAMILRRESNPIQVWAWLVYRICFNPYEIDFVQCHVERIVSQSIEGERLDESFRLRLKFDRDHGSTNMLPISDSMREFAVWYSQQDGDDWTCSMFFSYDIEDKRPCSLLLKSVHDQAASNITKVGFESLIQNKRRMERNESGDLPPELAGLIKRIGGKENKSSQKQSGGKTKPASKPVQQLPSEPKPQSNLSQNVQVQIKEHCFLMMV